VQIVPLQMKHKQALKEFVADFTVAGEDSIPAFLPNPDWSFEAMVREFDKQSRGEDLPDGWVPGTTRFLEHDGRLLGLFNLRHRLTDNLRLFGGHVGYSVRPSDRKKGYGTLLLESAKQEARQLGIDRVLVTCSPTNIGSAAVITKCGGKLQDTFFHEPMGHEVSRYWIELKESA